MSVALAYSALCLIWGTTYLAIRLTLESFPPYYMGSLRFLIAGLILSPVLFRKENRPPKSEWLWISLSGILMVTGANGLVNFAELSLDSGLTALTVSTGPAWTVLLGALFFSNKEKLDTWSIVGIFLAIAGVAVLHYHDISFQSDKWPAFLAVVFAPIFWSLGSLIVRHHVKTKNVMSVATIQMMAGTIFFFIISYLIGESWDISPTRSALFAFFYLIIFGSVITFMCYAYVLAHMPAARATTYSLVNPIIALIAGALILNEPITPEIIPAAVLILGGLVLVYVMRNRTAH